MTAPPAEVPAHYVGVGFRGGKGDATAAVLDSKIRLACNMDGLEDVDAMLTGGLDMALRRHLVVNLTINNYGF